MATAAKIPPRALTVTVMALLRQRMGELMVNYSDVARHGQVEISPEQTRKILKGEKPVTLEELDQICSALQVRLSDVVRRAEAQVVDAEIMGKSSSADAEEGGDEAQGMA